MLLRYEELRCNQVSELLRPMERLIPCLTNSVTKTVSPACKNVVFTALVLPSSVSVMKLGLYRLLSKKTVTSNSLELCTQSIFSLIPANISLSIFSRFTPICCGWSPFIVGLSRTTTWYRAVWPFISGKCIQRCSFNFIGIVNLSQFLNQGFRYG